MMNTIARWTCWIFAAIGGGVAVWSLHEAATGKSRLGLLYQAFYVLFALFNLVPLSGILVGRSLDGLPRRDRIITFFAWAIPTLLVLVIDFFVVAITRA